MTFDTVVNLLAVVSLVLTSFVLVMIQFRYYSYSRFNPRRLMYLTGAGASFTFAVQILARTSPFFDPLLRFLPVQPIEKILAFIVLGLVLHTWSHLSRSDPDHIRNTPIIPHELLPWK
jgi:hypothetical protein